MRRPELDRIEARLLELEARICLLDRATPAGFSAAVAQMAAGAVPLSESRLPVRPLLERDRVRGELERWGDELSRLAPDLLRDLLSERVAELDSEAGRAALLGSDNVREATLASLAPFRELLAEGDELARAWCLEAEGTDAMESEPLVSLEELALREVEERGLPIQVVARDMPSRAAAGSGTLFVQRRLRVARSLGERILLHELEAHLLPRLEAQSFGAPFSLGPALCGLDEEGFALELERQGAFLEGARRQELAHRYRAARAVLEGASAESIVTELCDFGHTREEAVRTWARAARGPGLGRDVAYLLGYLRVSRALRARPSLERWFRRGRMSVEAAEQLETVG